MTNHQIGLRFAAKLDSQASNTVDVSSSSDLISFDRMCRILVKSARWPALVAAHVADSDPTQQQDTGTISWNIDPFHFLSVVLYLFSNDVSSVEWGWRTEKLQVISTLVDMLFQRVPQNLLRSLLRLQLSTIKAAWRGLFRAVERTGHKSAISFLIEIGIQVGWIDFHLDGSRVLYDAVQTESKHIPALLSRGCRPEVFRFKDFDYTYRSRSAIVAALSKRRFSDAQALIQACDVNYSDKPSCHPTSFQLFLDLVKPTDDIFHRSLRLFLDRGADVDMDYYHYDNGRSWAFGRSCHYEEFIDAEHGRSVTINVDSEYYVEKFHFVGLLVNTQPSVADFFYYTNRKVFSVVAKYSRLDSQQVTRPGFLRALEADPNSVQQFVRNLAVNAASHVKSLVKFLVFEQFAILMGKAHPADLDLIMQTCRTVQALVDLDVDLSQLRTLHGRLEMDFVVVVFCVIREVPLSATSRTCLLDALELLLAKGVPVTPEGLAAAVRAHDPDFLRRLLPYMDDIKRQGTGALVQAARANNFTVVDILLAAGVDVNAPVEKCRLRYCPSVIDIGVLASFLEEPPPGSKMMEYLIEKGAVIGLQAGVRDPIWVLVHYFRSGLEGDGEAITRVHYIVEELIDVGDITLHSDLLLEACILSHSFYSHYPVKERLHLFEFLLQKGAVPRSGQLLTSAIMTECSLALATRLIDAGCDVNSRPNFRNFGLNDVVCQTPLQAAAYQGRLDLVTLLVNRGANINAPAYQNTGKTALQAICGWDPVNEEELEKQMNIVRYLIDHDADINAPPSRRYGSTALQNAARRGTLELAAFLLQHSADVNAPPPPIPRCFTYESSGKTALDLAVEYGRHDMVHFLLNANAISHYRGVSGYDGALRIAEKQRHFAIADLIRKHATSNEVLGLVNPHLSQPPRDYREYGYGSDTSDHSSDWESTPSQCSESDQEDLEREKEDGDEKAVQSSVSETRKLLGKLLHEINTRPGGTWWRGDSDDSNTRAWLEEVDDYEDDDSGVPSFDTVSQAGARDDDIFNVLVQQDLL